MKFLGLLLALFVIVVGIAGVFMPESLLSVGRYVITPAGLYAVAALRVGFGLVLIFVALKSRAPRTLRALGAVVVVAGLATPLFGVERVRAMFDWEAAQGTALVRVVGGLLVVLGSFLAFAIAAGRRPA